MSNTYRVEIEAVVVFTKDIIADSAEEAGKIAKKLRAVPSSFASIISISSTNAIKHISHK